MLAALALMDSVGGEAAYYKLVVKVLHHSLVFKKSLQGNGARIFWWLEKKWLKRL
jgi:hypothetical protein